MAKPTYDTWVGYELKEGCARFEQGHGGPPNVYDIAHMSHERLVSLREYENWLQACETKDLAPLDWVYETDGEQPPSGGGEGGGGETEPPTSDREWPDWRQHVRTDFDSGPFAFACAAPGCSEERQNEIIQLLLERGYTHWWGAIQFAPDPGQDLRSYDGLLDPAPLEGWMRKLAGARIVPMWSMFYGNNESWTLFCRTDLGGYHSEGREQFGHSNERFSDKGREWTRKLRDLWNRCTGRTDVGQLFVAGFEFDEFREDSNKDNRGLIEKIGWRALRDTWARIIHEESGHMIRVGVHLLDGHYCPQDGQGNDNWGQEHYYDKLFYFVLLQTGVDGKFYGDWVRKVVEKMKPIRNPKGEPFLTDVSEYVQEGSDEGHARALGQQYLAIPGVAGVENGC